MVSRDTSVHLVAVSVAFGVLIVASVVGVAPGSGPAGIAVVVALNGLFFGGAHLYLALRGEDGMVPVDARWRYVSLVVVAMGAGALALAAGGMTLASASLASILVAIVVLAAIVYLYVEVKAGYDAARRG